MGFLIILVIIIGFVFFAVKAKKDYQVSASQEKNLYQIKQDQEKALYQMKQDEYRRTVSSMSDEMLLQKYKEVLKEYGIASIKDLNLGLKYISIPISKNDNQSKIYKKMIDENKQVMNKAADKLKYLADNLIQRGVTTDQSLTFTDFNKDYNTLYADKTKPMSAQDRSQILQGALDARSQATFQSAPKERSVVKDAVIGGVIAGPAGAVVGAIHAADKNNQTRSNTSSSSGNRSVVKDAVVGGVIAGPAGAVVGAINAADKNKK